MNVLHGGQISHLDAKAAGSAPAPDQPHYTTRIQGHVYHSTRLGEQVPKARGRRTSHTGVADLWLEFGGRLDTTESMSLASPVAVFSIHSAVYGSNLKLHKPAL